MALNIDFDLDSHIPDEVLDRGWYVHDISNAEETKNGSLMVRALIIDGEKQSNGKDSVGREETYFLTVDTSRLAEWPRLQAAVRDTLKSFYDAAGKTASAAPEDFIGVKVLAHNTPRMNKKSGEREANWDKFKLYVEG